MALNSVQFILFFFGIVFIYYIVPQKLKNSWLIVANMIFYMFSGIKYAVVILAVTFLTYIYGIMLEKYHKKVLLVSGIVLTLAPLLLLKYLNFFILLVSSFVGRFSLNVQLPGVSFIIPLGISFFTLQGIAYIVDVYKGKISSEKNIIDYFAFATLFAYILSGPIERAGNILPQLKQKRKFDYTVVCHGLQMLLWGLVMKLIIAERFKMVADYIFNDYSYFSGFELFLGTLAFSAQLYFDFAGYSNIALGVAQAMNINIIQNFEQPYFSKSIAEFWRRWHISLSSWFKDYIYIPLGGSRKGKVRKYTNIFIVFLVSGLWHGASMHFVVWGMIHGVYQIIGGVTINLKKKIVKLCKINDTAFSYKLGKCFTTFLLVNFAWIFFRAASTVDAINIIKRIFGGFSLSATFGLKKTAEYSWRNVIGQNLTTSQDSLWMTMGLKQTDINILAIGTLIAVLVSVVHYKGYSIRAWLDKQNLYFRWFIYIITIFFVLTYGIYGSSYSSKSFIYANF